MARRHSPACADPASASLVLARMGLVLLIAAGGAAAQADSALDRLLTETLAFSAADVRKLDAGTPVIERLATPVSQELAYVGVVYIDVPAERFVERFRDIEHFERGPGVPQIGRFSNPPRIEDLQSLTLPAMDIAALETCHPGDCDLKLPASAMRRFQEDVEWASPDATRQAQAVMHEMLLALVSRYRLEGNAALGHYEDGGKPLDVAEEIRALLGRQPPLPMPVPELLDYLQHYPRHRPSGSKDFLYWSVVDFGLKPTLRVNHVTIYPLSPRPASGVAYVIAIKQLYASHYFHTSLELRFIVARQADEESSGMSLVSIMRSRNDGMTGFRGLFLRPIITRRSRDAVLGYLEHVKQQLENPRRPRSTRLDVATDEIVR